VLLFMGLADADTTGVQSVLGLVKVVIARLPAIDLETHLKSMVEGLMLWTDDTKNRFKAKVRQLNTCFLSCFFSFWLHLAEESELQCTV
jgi:hypothetical protein